SALVVAESLEGDLSEGHGVVELTGRPRRVGEIAIRPRELDAAANLGPGGELTLAPAPGRALVAAHRGDVGAALEGQAGEDVIAGAVGDGQNVVEQSVGPVEVARAVERPAARQGGIAEPALLCARTEHGDCFLRPTRRELRLADLRRQPGARRQRPRAGVGVDAGAIAVE